MRLKNFMAAVPFLLLAVLIVGCGKGKDSSKKDPIPVRVVTVKLSDIHRALDYAGDLKGRDEVKVYPKVSGKIIEKTREEGSDVNKGDAIMYIDRDEVGLKFEMAPVESPLTGKVGRVYVDIGTNVTPQTPVAFVADMSQAEIQLDIPEIHLPDLRIGQRAEVMVDSYPGEVFGGFITRISPTVDLATRTAPIEISIENPENKLQSGMFARVHLRLEERKNVPVIPKEAIIGRDPETYLYVIRDGKAHIEKVKLGIRQGPFYEVVSGVEAGDKVVIMGQQKLREGAIVRVEESE